MPLLYTLGCPVTDWPHFTANMLFELWEVPASIVPLTLASGQRGASTTNQTRAMLAKGSRACASRQGAGKGGASGGRVTDGASLAVRILYDGQPLSLPCQEAPWKLHRAGEKAQKAAQKLYQGPGSRVGQSAGAGRLRGEDGWVAVEDVRSRLSRLAADDEQRRQECNIVTRRS